MHQREKVLRTIKGEEKVVDYVFGSGILTANPPEIKDVKTYKVMKAFGFSIKFSNGKDKKPSYYALELWGNNAEHMAHLGFEGQLIEVAGRVTVSKYKNSKGADKELHTLTVERFTCLERKDKTIDSVDHDKDKKASEKPSIEEEESKNTQTIGTKDIPSGVEEIAKGNDEFSDDDIPF